MPSSDASSKTFADLLDLRTQTAAVLRARQPSLAQQQAVLGFDGFVDEIVRIVDKRESLQEYSVLATLSHLAERVAESAGKSTNLELVVQKTKIGGNGPIMANALATLGLPMTYIGILGYPAVHPVFGELTERAQVISIANPGHTDALEFDDGKLMMGKLEPLAELTWDCLVQRVGVEKMVAMFAQANLFGFLNWTMLPFMSNIWRHLLREVFPKIARPVARPFAFFDLADPEKRLASDIQEALELLGQFEAHLAVILGLNEKECHEIAGVLGLPVPDHRPDSLRELAAALRARLDISCIVIHPRAFAVAAEKEASAHVPGPFDPKPLISTGAGDHFNAGFCLGKLLNLSLEGSLLAGVSTSGYYVRTATSPTVQQLAGFMES
ncbi:MAG: PfkB family carbohydrate kinase [bacterium]